MKVSGIFGLHGVPLRIDREGISLSVERTAGGFLYKRECMDEEVEDILLSSNSKILINPVEPVNTPKELTPHFLIEFERPVFIEPSARRTVFVKFPVEIGVFVHGTQLWKPKKQPQPFDYPINPKIPKTKSDPQSLSVDPSKHAQFRTYFTL